MITLMEPAIPAAEEAVTSPAAQRIVLTGFMGAGKSTIGRLLALQLGWHFLDTDAGVEQRHGQTIAQMFQDHGEAVFRRRESAAIARALGQRHVVIAVGGGAPEFLNNRLLMEQTRDTAIVFLDAPFHVLFDRCVMQEGTAVRPVLLDAETAAERYRLRLPFYHRCASLRIATAGLIPSEVVHEILHLLRKQTVMER